jgi:predicted dehydrogenase
MRGNFEGAFLKEWNQEEREIPRPEGDEEPPFRKEIRLFAEAVLEKRPVPIPGEEGLWSVAMAEAFERSAQLGQPVSVNRKDP